MSLDSSRWSKRLRLGLIMSCFALGLTAQEAEPVAFSVTLPDGQTGGLRRQATITNLLQQPEGLYVLTERHGCYLLSDDPTVEHQVVALPSSHREKFNSLIKRRNGIALIVNHRALRSQGVQDFTEEHFTTAAFEDIVNPTRMLVSQQGYIVVGTVQDGIFIFKPDTEGRYRSKAEHISTADKQLPSNAIKALYEDRYGTIWIGTDQGIATLSDDKINNLSIPSERAWWQRDNADNSKPQYFGQVDAFTQWGDSILFVGEQAIHRISINPQQLEFHYKLSLEEQLPEPITGVEQLIADLDGNLWIAANQLIRYSIVNEQVRIFGRAEGIRGQAISTILEDPGNQALWIGTRRGGLYRLRI